VRAAKPRCSPFERQLLCTAIKMSFDRFGSAATGRPIKLRTNGLHRMPSSAGRPGAAALELVVVGSIFWPIG